MTFNRLTLITFKLIQTNTKYINTVCHGVSLTELLVALNQFGSRSTLELQQALKQGCHKKQNLNTNNTVIIYMYNKY